MGVRRSRGVMQKISIAHGPSCLAQSPFPDAANASDAKPAARMVETPVLSMALRSRFSPFPAEGRDCILEAVNAHLQTLHQR
eukprot:752365-Hanusia_phi.AAC.4